MKTFELKAKLGRKVVLVQHFTFTEEQEKEFLEQILAGKNTRHTEMGWEIEGVISYEGSSLKRGKNRVYDESRLQEFIENHPDTIIAAAISAQNYDLGWPTGSVTYDLPKGVVQENLIDEFGQFGWYCKRIK